MAGIKFPGTTYPEVNRIAPVSVGDPVTLHDNGDIDFPELGRLPFPFNRTDRGMFAFAPTPGTCSYQTVED